MISIYPRKNPDFTHNGALLEQVKNPKVSRELNGSWTLTFELPVAYEKNKSIHYEDFAVCEGQRYRVTAISKSTDTKTAVYTCSHVSGDGAYRFIPLFEAMMGVGPYEIMVKAFAGTPYHVMTAGELAPLGMEWETTLTDIFDTDKTTPPDLVSAYVKATGKGEFYADNYNIALVRRLGRDLTRTASTSLNLKSIGEQGTSAGVVTRLYPFGKDDMCIKGDAVYIDSELGISLFGVKEGYKDYPEITDQDELLKRAQYEFAEDNLLRIDLPDLAYDVGAVDLRGLYGDTYAVNIGDKMTIHDAQLDIDVARRVIKHEYDPETHQGSAITLGKPPRTYSQVVGDLQTSSDNYDKVTLPNGEVKSNWLENIKRNLRTQANNIPKSRPVVEHKSGDIWLDPGNPDRALLVSDSLLAIANRRNANGDWEWNTFGTADGFTADVINSGVINSELVNVVGDNGQLRMDGNGLTATDADNGIKVYLGTRGGLRISKDGQTTGGIDTQGNLVAGKLRNRESGAIYGIVGAEYSGAASSAGLFLYHDGKKVAQLQEDDGGVMISSGAETGNMVSVTNDRAWIMRQNQSVLFSTDNMTRLSGGNSSITISPKSVEIVVNGTTVERWGNHAGMDTKT